MTNDQWTNEIYRFFRKRNVCNVRVHVCLYAPRQGFYTSSMYSDTGTRQAESLCVNYIMYAFVLICLKCWFFDSFCTLKMMTMIDD